MYAGSSSTVWCLQSPSIRAARWWCSRALPTLLVLLCFFPVNRACGLNVLPKSLWATQHSGFLKELQDLTKQIPLSFAVSGQLEFKALLWSGRSCLVKALLRSPLTLCRDNCTPGCFWAIGFILGVSANRGMKEPDKVALWFKILESPENLAMLQLLEWLLSLCFSSEKHKHHSTATQQARVVNAAIAITAAFVLTQLTT